MQQASASEVLGIGGQTEGLREAGRVAGGRVRRSGADRFRHGGVGEGFPLEAERVGGCRNGGIAHRLR